MSGKLDDYLMNLDTKADELYEKFIKQLVEQEGITEQLKATDMLAWVQAMNNISNCAREIVSKEIIFTI